MIRVDIRNDGTNKRENRGNYDVTVFLPGEVLHGRVLNYNRVLGWEELVHQAVDEVVSSVNLQEALAATDIGEPD